MIFSYGSGGYGFGLDGQSCTVFLAAEGLPGEQSEVFVCADSERHDLSSSWR